MAMAAFPSLSSSVSQSVVRSDSSRGSPPAAPIVSLPSSFLSSATAASAAVRRARHQQKRIRRAGLWSLVLPALLQHNITIQTKRNQHIRGTLAHVTLDLNLTLTSATSHYPALTRTQPAAHSPQLAADVVGAGGGSGRSVRVGAVWLCRVGCEVWDEVVVSVRHVRCVIPPVGFQLHAAAERQERKRQQGQRLYARRKLNANKAGVG